MPRNKETFPNPIRRVPIRCSRQIPPDTFEFAFNELVDGAVELTVFNQRDSQENTDVGLSARRVVEDHPLWPVAGICDRIAVSIGSFDFSTEW